MAISLGTAYLSTGVDLSGLQRGLEQAGGQVNGWASETQRSFQRVGETMLGVLAAQAIPAIINGFSNIARQAISVTSNLQSMQIGMEGLLAREISKGQEVITSRQVRTQLTAAEAEKLQDLILQRDKLNARMQEETERHRQLIAKWGEEGLAVKTHTADMAILKDKLDDAADSIGKLQAKQGGLATVFDKTRVNTKSLSDAMPEAQARAKRLMDELARIAILSPFQLDVINSTFKQAMAFGYSADEAKTFTQAMLNVAAGVGAGNEQLGRMAYNFAQIRMVGKVTAVDIRQLAMAGFDLVSVLQFAGQKYKVVIRDHEDFNAAIAAGKITWEQFTEAFKEYADKNFGGAAERMSRTLTGLKSTFSDVFALTLPQVVAPALEQVTGLLSRMLDQFLGIRDSGALETLGQRLGAAAQRALGPIGRLLDYIEGIQKAKGGMAGLGALQAGGASDLLGGALQSAFGPGVLKPLNALRDAVAMLSAALATTRNAAARVWDAISPLLQGIAERISGFVQFKDLIAGLGLLLASAVAPALLSAAGALISFLAPIAAVTAGVALLRTAWEQNWGGIQEKVAAVSGAVQVAFAAFTGNFDGIRAKLPEMQATIDGVFGSGTLAQVLAFGRDAGMAFEGLKAKIGAFVAGAQGAFAIFRAAFTGDFDAVRAQLPQLQASLDAALGAGATAKILAFGRDAGAAFDTAKAKLGELMSAFQAGGLPAVGDKLAEWWTAIQTYVATNAPMWAEQIRSQLGQVWRNLTLQEGDSSTQLTAFGSFMQTLMLGWTQFAATVKQVWEQLASFFGPTIERIKAAVQGFGEQWTTLQPKLTALWEAAQPVAEFLGTVLAGAVALIASLVSEVLAASLSNILPLIGNVADIFTNLFNIITGNTPVIEGLGGIITALGGIIDGFAGVLWNGLVNTINNALGASLPLWDEFKNGVAKRVIALRDDFLAKVDEIVVFIEELPQRLLTLGENIVDGLWDGITGAWTRMLAKFQQLVDALPAAIKAILGISSPSKVFAEIGENMMAGMAVGIEAGAPVAMDAMLSSLHDIMAVIAEYADAQEALNSQRNMRYSLDFAERASAIMDGVTAVLDGLDAIAVWHAPRDVAKKAAELIRSLVPIVDALADYMESLNATGMTARIARTQILSESLAGIIGSLTAMVDGLSALNRLKIDADKLGVRFSELMRGLRMVVAGFIELANGISGNTLGTAMLLANQLGQALVSLSAVPEAIQELIHLPDISGITTGRGWAGLAGLGGFITALAEQLRAAQTELDANGGLDNELLDFVDHLAKLPAPFTAALNAWQELNTVLAKGRAWRADVQTLGQLSTAIGELVSAARFLALELARAQTWTGLDFDLAPFSTFAEQLSKLFQPLNAAVQALQAAADLPALTTDVQTLNNLSTAIGETVRVAKFIAIELARAQVNEGLDYDLTPITTVAGQLKSLLEPFQSILTFWKTLEGSADLIAQVTARAGDSQLFMLVRAALTDYAVIVQQMADVLNWQPPAEGEYGYRPDATNPFAGLSDRLVSFAKDLSGLLAPFQNILTFWQALDTQAAAIEQATADMATGGGRLRAALTAALASYGLIVSELAAALAYEPPAEGEYGYRPGATNPFKLLNDDLLAFAKDLADLGGSLSHALGFLTDLAAWEATADLAAKFTVFRTQWADILNQLADLRRDVSITIDEDLRSLITGAGEIADGLSKAVGFLIDLAVWEEGADLDGKMERLVTVLGAMLDDLKPLVAKWDAEGLQTVNAFGQAVSNVMGGLKAALDLAIAVPKAWAAPATGAWDSFFGWATGVFESFAAQVTTWVDGEILGPGGVRGRPLIKDATVVGQVAGAFGQVMGGLKSALDLALAVPKSWSLPDPTAWDAFFGWATGVFTAFASQVDTWINGEILGPGGVRARPAVGDATVVGQVASAFGQVMTGLKGALDLALATPKTWSLPGAEQWDGFFTWATGVFDSFSTAVTTWAAEQSDPTAKASLVGAVGQALSSVMQGLGGALGVLKGLVWYVAPAQGNIAAFLQGVKLVFEQVRDGAAGELTAAQAEATKTFSDVMGGLFGALQSAIGLLTELDKFAIDPAEQGSFAHKVQQFNEALSLAIDAWQLWIVNELEPDTATLVADFADVVAQIAAGFQSALSLLTQINEGGVPSTQRLRDFLDAVLLLFGDFAKNLAAATKPDDWSALGRDMLGGLRAGIVAERPALLAAARSAAYDAYLAVKTALGIASPSKLFATLGVQIPAGVVQGIESGQAAVDRAVSGLFGATPAQVSVSGRGEMHVYLHGEGLADLGAQDRRNVVAELGEYLALNGLRVAVAG